MERLYGIPQLAEIGSEYTEAHRLNAAVIRVVKNAGRTKKGRR